MQKKLTRNTRNKMIAGVSSGLADYFQLDVTWVRLAFALAAFFGGSGIWIYIILWIAVPANHISIFDYTEQKDDPFETLKTNRRKFNPNLIGGLLLIVLGSYFLLDEFDILPYWFTVSKLWPLIFVGIGLAILFKGAKDESREDMFKESFSDEEQKAEEDFEEKKDDNSPI